MNNKNFYNILVLTVFFSILSIPNAFAYLDPGTGSIILQALIAFIATASATIVYYWRKIKLILKRIFKKEEKNNTLDK
mgnify:CR=1 FL=1|tara:strand:- start:4204 stop:4437 length:234 start_codon:yes stop_codon:yes gene_type:complete